MKLKECVKQILLCDPLFIAFEVFVVKMGSKRS